MGSSKLVVRKQSMIFRRISNTPRRIAYQCPFLPLTQKKNNQPQKPVVSVTEFTPGCPKSKTSFQKSQNDILHGTGTQVDFPTLASRLRQCGNAKDLSEGKRIHSHIIKSGHGRDRFLGNLLVQMYGKCGALEDAHVVFAKLYRRNVFSWTIMIGAFAQHGQGNQAFQLFEQMLLEGVTPSKVTFVSILSVCAGQAALAEGKRIHSYIIGSGLESDVVVGTALLSMYAKCGNLQDARRIFDRMHERDAVSWNAMIAAYAQHGRGKEALQLFEQMQLDGLILNKITFVSVLDACASQAALAEGKRMHAHILDLGIESDVDMGNTIINMYGKCGSLEDAQRMFDKMLERNLGSWNAIIAAYVQRGQSKTALQLFQQMQMENVVPDKFTFASILAACASQAALSEGKRVHAWILASQLGSDVVLGNAIINMYGKCGCVEDARKMFDKMSHRTVVSWNAIITAYANNGQGKEALQLFYVMQADGMIPDKVTFVSILDACASQGCIFDECVNQAALTEGRRMHDHIVGRGFESDIIVGTALLNMYGKCGSLEDARMMFDKMPEHDVISWNAMIAAYAQHGQGKEALQLFQRMVLEGHCPDRATFASALDACASLASLVEGEQMHARIMGAGFVLDVVLGNGLINMYGKCGSVVGARRIFDEMPERNVVTWTAMIATYAQHSQGKEALQLFQQMQLEGVSPDKVTFVSILDACSSQAALADGKQIHSLIVDTGFEGDVVVGTALVGMYGKCGNPEDAVNMFDKMHERNVFSWTAMIAVYGQHGQGQEALQLFQQMQVEGTIPNKLTYVRILSACSHAGLVDEGCHCFVSMNLRHDITPMMEHYNCMIDLLGRAGRLDEGEDLINNLPVEPTSIGWTALLGACRMYSDIERGKHAAEHIFKLDPENATPYVLLANTYAAAGRWDDRAKVRKMMEDKGLEAAMLQLQLDRG